MNNKILIFHLASIGDTVVALPALRLIKNAYPYATRIGLTAKHADTKAASMEEVLDGTNLIHDFIYLEPGKFKLFNLTQVIRDIKKQNIDVLIYLNEPSSFSTLIKHYIFFKACGINKIIGMPSIFKITDSKIKRKSKDRWESISEYLVRKIKALGDIDSNDKKNFDLCLGGGEHAEILTYLEPHIASGIIGVSFGSKIDLKDWGDVKWESLLGVLATKYPQNRLLIVGSQEEYERAQRLTQSWSGKRINLCGKLSVRASALALSKCIFYVGHDNGPMHLAAAVGLRCVAIFSSRSLPGVWFPSGDKNKILYTNIECQGCERTICIERKKECIARISPQDVLNEIDTLMNDK